MADSYDALAQALRPLLRPDANGVRRDRRRVSALLADMLPEADRERRVVSWAIDDGMLDTLERAPPDRLGLEIDRLRRRLEDRLGVREELATGVLRAIAYGLALSPLPSEPVGVAAAAVASPSRPQPQQRSGTSDSWVGVSAATAAPPLPQPPQRTDTSASRVGLSTATAAPPAAGQQRSRPLMLILIVLAFVGVAGGGGWFLLNGADDAEAPVDKPAVDRAAPDRTAPTSPPPPSSAGAPVRWRVASSFPRSAILFAPSLTALADDMRGASGGSFDMRVHPAGELIPAFQVLDAVQQGSVEAGWSIGGYYARSNPAFGLLGGMPFGPGPEAWVQWLRRDGADTVDRLFQPLGVKAHVCGMGGPEADLWLRLQANSLRGLRLVVPGSPMSEVVKRAGASVDLLSRSEYYPALEKGTIDGLFGAGLAADHAVGLQRVARYVFTETSLRPAVPAILFINARAYSELSADARRLLAASCERQLDQTLTEQARMQVSGARAVRDSRVDMRPMPRPIVDSLAQHWRQYAAEQAQGSQDFRRLHDALQAARR